MTDNEVLAEIKKMVDFHLDGTYEVSDLYSHLLTIVNEKMAQYLAHKNQMERLLFKADELREHQRLYHAGHKNLLGKVKKLEGEMDAKIHNLQTMGYCIDRFKNKVVQKTLL